MQLYKYHSNTIIDVYENGQLLDYYMAFSIRNYHNFTIPQPGYTKKLQVVVSAVDADGLIIPNYYYYYSGNTQGITVYQTGTNTFDVIVDSTFDAGPFFSYLDFTVGYTGTYRSGLCSAPATLQFDTPVLTSVTAADVSLSQPQSPPMSNRIYIDAAGCDQYGDEIDGLSYNIENIPYGVALVSAKDGMFALDVSFRATPGIYKLNVEVKDGSTTIVKPVYLTIHGTTSATVGNGLYKLVTY